MELKKAHLLIVFSFIFMMSVGMIFLTTTTLSVATDDNEEENTISSESVLEPKEAVSLQVGDILLQRDIDGDIISAIVPGPWVHTAIYAGNDLTVEACEYGVIESPISKFYGKMDVYRVSTSSSKKGAAVNFAYSKLGLPYDFIWLTYIGGKEVNGNEYYCSELAWAAYKAQGVDIDQNPGWSWTYGNNVCPCELAYDSDTYFVGTI